MSGSSSYSDFTHLSLHRGGVTIPYRVDFDLPQSNTTTYYLTYGNLGGEEMFTDDTLTVLNSTATKVYNYDKSVVLFLIPPLSFTPRSINILVNIVEVTGAVRYMLTYQTDTVEESTAFSGFTDLVKNIKSLQPETLYTVRLYTDSGSGYVLTHTDTATTLVDTNDNIEVSDFLDGTIYDLSSLGPDAKSILSSHINSRLGTGDDLLVRTDKNKIIDAAFVNLNDSAPAEDALLVPFDVNSGTSQTINLVLADSSVVQVHYHEGNNTIEINSTIYSAGDVFVIGGKKSTFFNF